MMCVFREATMRSKKLNGCVFSGPDLKSGLERDEHVVENEQSTVRPFSRYALCSLGRIPNPAHC